MASSRPYRVKVRESVREHIVTDDSVKSKLEIVPVLPPEQTEQITRGILKEHGFEENGDTMSRERGGVNVTIDPRTSDVEARSEGSADIDISDEEDVDQGGCPCRVRSEESVIEAMRRRLAKKAEGIKQSVQELVTGRLQGQLADLGCELEQISNQVTGRALKRRAQEIGRIKHIRHDDGTGEIMITVEV